MIDHNSPPLAEDLLEHRLYVRRLARSLVGNDHEVDEVVQQTWLKILKRPPIHGRAIRSWLSCVVRSVAFSRRESESARRHHESERGSFGVGQETIDEEEIEALRVELSQALSRLGEVQARTLRLRYFEGLGLEAIALQEGVAVETVRSRVKRGLKRLREAMDERHRGDSMRYWPALVALAGMELPRIGRASWLAPLTVTASLGLGTVALLAAWRGIHQPREEPGPIPLAAAAPADLAPAKRELVPMVGRTSVGEGASVEPSGAQLTVELVDSLGGGAVSDAVISLQGLDPLGERQMLKSNEAGRAMFADLEPGTWSVAAERGEPRLVRLEEGAHETVTLSFFEGIDLFGRALDPDGQPIAGAEVWVSLPGSRDHGRVHARSDELGLFTVSGLDPEAWIGVRAAGFRPSRMRWSRDAWESGELELRLRAGSAFHGRVFDEAQRPLPGATVTVVNDPPAPRRSRDGLLVLNPGTSKTRTDDEGRFALPEVLWSGAWIEASCPGFHPQRERINLAGADRNLREGGRPLTFQLEKRSSGSLRSSEPIGADSATIQGVVRDLSGRPLPGATVFARPVSDGERPLSYHTVWDDEQLAVSDEGGRFRLGADPGGEPMQVFLLGDEGRRGPPLGMEVDGTGEWTPWKGLRGVITGEVVGGDRGATRVFLTSTALARPLMRSIPGGGAFRFEGLLPGVYTLSITTEGDLFEGVAEVRVAEGERRDIGRLTSFAKATIEGRVSVEGHSLESLRSLVELIAEDGTVLVATSGKVFPRCEFHLDGRFRFEGLDPGRYTLGARVYALGAAVAMDVQLEAGERHVLSIELEEGREHQVFLTSKRLSDAKLAATIRDREARTLLKTTWTLTDGETGGTLKLPATAHDVLLAISGGETLGAVPFAQLPAGITRADLDTDLDAGLEPADPASLMPVKK